MEKGLFEREILYVDGYHRSSLSKRKVSRESFIDKSDLAVDRDHIMSALDNGAKGFIFSRKGRIKALYLLKSTEEAYICYEVIYAPDVPNTSRDDMDRCISFELSQDAFFDKGKKAVFKGTVLPPLFAVKTDFNWSMAVSFAFIYGMLFSGMGGLGGWLLGGLLGFVIGGAIEKKKLKYDKKAKVF